MVGALLAGLAVGAGSTASGDEEGVRYQACVNNSSGTIKMIAADGTCGANDVRIEWNQQGPAGPVGQQGQVGPMGPAGPAGGTGSIDDLDGTPCRADSPLAGFLQLSYDHGEATLTCRATATHPLTIEKQGIGTGSVASDVTGIDCGETCEFDYPAGVEVTLTATAATGHRFTGWGGGCTGSGVCTVSLDQAVAVTATFVPEWTLAVRIRAEDHPDCEDDVFMACEAGGGSVSTFAVSMNCTFSSRGGEFTCSPQPRLAHDAELILIAAPMPGSRFIGWSGGCSGTGIYCTLRMTADTSVVANFQDT